MRPEELAVSKLAAAVKEASKLQLTSQRQHLITHEVSHILAGGLKPCAPNQELLQCCTAVELATIDHTGTGIVIRRA